MKLFVLLVKCFTLKVPSSTFSFDAYVNNTVLVVDHTLLFTFYRPRSRTDSPKVTWQVKRNAMTRTQAFQPGNNLSGSLFTYLTQ